MSSADADGRVTVEEAFHAGYGEWLEWLYADPAVDFDPFDPAPDAQEWIFGVHCGNGSLPASRLAPLLLERRGQLARRAGEMLGHAFASDGGTAGTAPLLVQAPSEDEPMGVVQFGHERIRSISSAAAAVEVAEGFQCWLADTSGVVWPVCPVHRAGVRPRLVSGAAAWVCSAGGHVIPVGGFGGGRAVGEDHSMTSSAVPAVFAGPIRVVGLGLLLREWEAGDAPAMVELFDDAEVARWTPLASPFDLAAADRYYQRAQERRAQGLSVQLAVTTDGRTPLGDVSAFRRGDDGREVELGYAIGAEHRGRRLATRSVRLLTGFAYRELEARRVILRIEPGNEASRAVARATGYRLADQPQASVTDPDGSEVLLDIWEHARD